MKPTLGFPSRIEAVIALQRRGLKPPAIAEMIGVSLRTAEVMCSPYYQSRAARGQRTIAVRLPRSIADRVAAEAAARKITAPELVERLVAAIVADGIVDAVLDDGDRR